MLTGTNRIWIYLLALLSAPASAEELLRVPETVAGFADHASRDSSVLLLSSDGQAYWANAKRALRSVQYRIENDRCRPTTQSTAMGAPGMTLAYPFLVGLSHACFIDEGRGTIRLIADYGNQLPSNAFSASFAGEDSDAAYFVINGRPWETEGYLMGLTIRKKDRQTSVRTLVTGVPGYSGGMVYHDHSLWVTVWEGSNSIHRVDGGRLLSLFKTGSTADFGAIAERKREGIEGLSLYVLVNEEAWLYLNGEYGSYLVAKRDGSRTPLSPKCEPIAGAGTGWMLLCGGHALVKTTKLD